MRFTPAQAVEMVERWNELHPLGTAVLYDPVVGLDAARVERTRTPAHVILRDRPVVWITNHGCAMALAWLQPLSDFQALQIERPLLRARNAFGLVLHENPTVSHQGLPIERVAGDGLNPHPPHFAMLLLQVLEWKRNLRAVLESESIEQLAYIARLHKAADEVFVLALYTELFIQIGRYLERPNLISRLRGCNYRPL